MRTFSAKRRVNAAFKEAQPLPRLADDSLAGKTVEASICDERERFIAVEITGRIERQNEEWRARAT